MKLNDDDFSQMSIDLGALGEGTWYLCTCAAVCLDRTLLTIDDLGNAVAPEDYGDVDLSGWCVARSRTTLIFMKTEGYTSGYLDHHSAPGGTHFWPAGFSVKSRDSDSTFMILEPNCMFDTTGCSDDEMIEYARRWGGYRITNEEFDYYWEVISAADKELTPGAVPLAER